MERYMRQESDKRIRPLALLAALVYLVIVSAVGWQVYVVVTNQVYEHLPFAPIQMASTEPAAPPFIPISIDGPTLWRNEAASLSRFPEGLYALYVEDEGLAQYANNFFGYSFSYPSDWTIDTRAVAHYTRLFNDDFRVDITVQDVTHAWTNPTDFMWATLHPLRDRITSDENKIINSLNVRIVEYDRPLIEGIENDMNHYAYFFIIRNNLVYVMQLKANEENFDEKREAFEEVLETFTLIERQELDITSEIINADPGYDLTLRHANKTLDIPDGTFMMGLYVEENTTLAEREADLEVQLGLEMLYQPIDTRYDPYLGRLVERDTLAMVTFLFEEGDVDENETVVRNILNGEYDETLADWGQNLSYLGAPILVRLGNEMNGSWTDWSLQHNYNDPDLYKLAFVHISNVFRTAGANNAYFVWNPNGNHAPFYAWNHAALFYPGDAVVNFVGMTHYHFGAQETSDFRELYEDIYWEYAALFYQRHMMIGEFGAVERETDKAQWITDAFNSIPTYFPRVKLAVWFDARHGFDAGLRGPDLRIDTSPESLAAFREGMVGPSVIRNMLDSEE
ncbi:MAG: glycoside hydrolase family 26 protein [Coriobacteriia bacterium]|nr:glycoside hydrolase family 26 protein [Coriobacteriia bacterium]